MPALNPVRTGNEMKAARNPSRRTEPRSRAHPTMNVSAAAAAISCAPSPPAACCDRAPATRIAIVEVVVTLNGREVPVIA